MCPNLIIGGALWVGNTFYRIGKDTVDVLLTIDLGNFLAGSIAAYVGRTAVIPLGAPQGVADPAVYAKDAWRGAHRLAPFGGLQFMFFDAMRSLTLNNRYSARPSAIPPTKESAKEAFINATACGGLATAVASVICNPFAMIRAQAESARVGFWQGAKMLGGRSIYPYYFGAPSIAYQSALWGLAFGIEEQIAVNLGAPRLGATDAESKRVNVAQSAATHAVAGGIAGTIARTALGGIGWVTRPTLPVGLLHPAILPFSVQNMARVAPTFAITFGLFDILNRAVVQTAWEVGKKQQEQRAAAHSK